MNKALLSICLACLILVTGTYLIWAYTDVENTDDMSAAALKGSQKNGAVNQTVFDEMVLKVPLNTERTEGNEVHTTLESGTIVYKEHPSLKPPTVLTFNWLQNIFGNLFQ